MDKKYSVGEYEEISKRIRTVKQNGIDLRIVPTSDSDIEGIPAPVIAGAMKAPAVLNVLSKMIEKNLFTHPEKIARNNFNQISSIPIIDSVDMLKTIVVGKGGNIPIRIFTPKNHGENLPVLYFIHGGGFFAGNAEGVSEACKMICEKTGCIAVTLDYRLAPENPYPCGLEDCLSVLEWIYNRIGKYHGDKNRICISGDSAGGNLAATCAVKDRDDGTNKIKAQVLLYPTLNISRTQDEFCDFSIDVFQKARGYEKGISAYIKLLGDAMNLMPFVLKADNLADPYVSPYNAKAEGLAPCKIIYGEFDCLRTECEAYARKLKKSGVKITLTRFSGFIHAFLNGIGVEPQAELCVDEICLFINDILQNASNACI